jgi:glycerate 2-kinase
MPPESNPALALSDKLVRAILDAADPARLLERRLMIDGDAMQAGSHRFPLHDASRLRLVVMGKAAVAMCRTALDILGDRVAAGVAAVPSGSASSIPAPIQAIEAGHPLPDDGSVQAGEAAASMLTDSTPEDRLLALISGGGSAMFERPANGVTLQDLRKLNLDLMRAGAGVREINLIRKALSTVKGGGLARLASPAPVLALVLSDVVGDSLADVASGPTVPQPDRPAAVRRTLERYALWQATSEGIRQAALTRRRLSQPLYRPVNLLLGSNRLALNAAVDQLTAAGYDPVVVTNAMQGEARNLGRGLADRLRDCEPGTALLEGGETTVTVHGDGEGGPNTEFALSAAIALDGQVGTTVLALATDGSDGSTDCAGAIIDGDSAGRMRAAGIDPEDHLERNDSYHALASINALIHTGPTGTNVNHVVIGLVGRGGSQPD